MPKQVKQPIMSPDQERYMAFAGVQQWALAVVDRRDDLRRILALTYACPINAPRRGQIQARTILLFQMQSAATDFCTAIMLLYDFVEWSNSFGDFQDVISSEFYNLDWSKIRDARNMRVHVDEYFKGEGRNQDRWLNHRPDSLGDASGIFGTLIGNRVDYEEIGGIVERMLEAMLNESIPYPPR